MIKFIFAVFLALVLGSEAFATVDVAVQGNGGSAPGYQLDSTSGAATLGATRNSSDFGINTSFGSRASIGVLKAYAHIDSPKGINSSLLLLAGGLAEYYDTLHVTGSGPATFHFSVPTTGTIEPNSVEAYGLGNLSVYGDGFSLDLGKALHMNNGVLSVDQNLTAADITFNPGTVV